jgi:hypothetical protein
MREVIRQKRNAPKPDASKTDLIDIMLAQAELEVFTDEEILDEVVIFYMVCLFMYPFEELFRF